MLNHISLLAVFAASTLAQPVSFDRRSDRQYPEPYSIPDSSLTPTSWTDALQAAVAAGKIPNIPVATNNNGNPVYSGIDGGSNTVCSWTVSKCYAPDDVHDAANNSMGLSFDDGPTPASDQLYDFLGSHSQSATHFYIGSNILSYKDQFKHALSLGNQHIASHTFSHQPLSTTLTNEQLVAELGWTSQIIYDLSGLVPAYWRPPQGDVDNRVRAIAKELFGLTTVLWNQDTNDWCLQSDGTSACSGESPGEDYDSVANAANSYITTNDRSKGLIMLEHELTSQTVSVFMNYYPKLAGLGWKVTNIPEIWSAAWYTNAFNSTSPKTTQTSILVSNASTPLNPAAVTTSSVPAPTKLTSNVTSKATSNVSSVAPQKTAANPSAPTALKAQSSDAMDLIAPSMRTTWILIAAACLAAAI